MKELYGTEKHAHVTTTGKDMETAATGFLITLLN
jgi:hypothetical protein